MCRAVAIHPLRPVLRSLGADVQSFARGAGLSAAVAERMARSGLLPLRHTADACRRAAEFLESRGIAPEVAAELCTPTPYDPKKVTPPGSHLAGSFPGAPDTTATLIEEDTMLLRHETLTPLARQHFGLSRSPFVDDVQEMRDVHLTRHGKYVRMAMLDAARNHGFVAIIGQSGSGKSTLREELEERIRNEGLNIVLIKPYVQGMEQSEVRGKPLRSSHLAEAIVDALAPGVALKQSPQARYKQVHELLKNSRSIGNSHLLLIEEAHRLPVPTLKHLKNFLEMKEGLRRLIGVCLIGQNELFNILSERNPEVREIVQRCEQIAMQPLDDDIEAYLSLKFDRVGRKLADVLEVGTVDAIRARLVRQVAGHRTNDVESICYPQVVNNLVCRALNAAATTGYAKVDAEVIAGC